jgi:LmbE family N-acetylglucosaminyl deacetylase
MARNVYFFAPHQDDETLFMAQAIAHHVLAGRPVHVVLMSTGATSGVLAELNGTSPDPTWWGGAHDPAAEGYATLTAAEFGLARTREWSQALRHLGVPIERQHFGAGLASSDLLPDSITQAHATAVMQHWLAADLAEGLDPPGFYAMHWQDPHADHAACGLALKALRQADPQFSDSRWLVKPEQAAAVGALPYAVPAGLLSQVRLMQKHAAWAYGAWAPEQGAFAVGMHSVRSYFEGGPLAGAVNHIVRNP